LERYDCDGCVSDEPWPWDCCCDWACGWEWGGGCDCDDDDLVDMLVVLLLPLLRRRNCDKDMVKGGKWG
jgi:hypothetical protein